MMRIHHSLVKILLLDTPWATAARIAWHVHNEPAHSEEIFISIPSLAHCSSVCERKTRGQSQTRTARDPFQLPWRYARSVVSRYHARTSKSQSTAFPVLCYIRTAWDNQFYVIHFGGTLAVFFFLYICFPGCFLGCQCTAFHWSGKDFSGMLVWFHPIKFYSSLGAACLSQTPGLLTWTAVRWIGLHSSLSLSRTCDNYGCPHGTL